MTGDKSAAEDTKESPDTPAGDNPAPKPKARRKRKSRAGTASKKRERDRELARELLMELTTLRSTLAEIVERFSVRVGGQYAELIGQLDPGLLDLNAPPAAVSQLMVDRIRKTALKPRKARAKDLSRLEKL